MQYDRLTCCGNLPDARERVQFDLLAHDAEINGRFFHRFLGDIFSLMNFAF